MSCLRAAQRFFTHMASKPEKKQKRNLTVPRRNRRKKGGWLPSAEVLSRIVHENIGSGQSCAFVHPMANRKRVVSYTIVEFSRGKRMNPSRIPTEV